MQLNYKDDSETTAISGEFSSKRVHVDFDTAMTTVSGEYFKTVSIDAEMLEDQTAVLLGYGDSILATLLLDSKGIHFTTE